MIKCLMILGVWALSSVITLIGPFAIIITVLVFGYEYMFLLIIWFLSAIIWVSLTEHLQENR